jgi:hypothetical protein
MRTLAACPPAEGRSDSLVMCPEYKVVIPLGRDRLCRIRKARKTHLREAGEVVEKA